MAKGGKILVVGSIVLDIILGEEFFGGTGSNIAYGLGKFKSSPMLFSLAGRDFKKDFGPHLARAGVDLKVEVDEKNKTANFICLPHKKGHAGEIWKPNAYKKIHKVSLHQKVTPKEIKKVSIAIFSAGTPTSTLRHMREFRDSNSSALLIFDPGQMTKFYSKKYFIDCVNFADILILNALEYSQIKKTLGHDPAKYLNSLSKTLIKTKGAKGSEILENNRIIKVLAIKPKLILDLTGAGDAYRAGLIYGLWKGLTLENACTLGARTASKSIGYMGCEMY